MGPLPKAELACFTAMISFAMPRLVSACAVCTGGRDDETNTAFLISTIFLSLLPLAALGTLVFVLWRRIRALEQETTALGGADSTAALEDSGRPVLPIA